MKYHLNRHRQKELEKLRAFEEKENRLENNYSSGLEKFDINKTKEINIDEIVTQGGPLGPIMASLQIDTIGKEALT